MQKQHQMLHTQEKILRYELAQKRKLLTELKEELEYSREKWTQAREKNSNTELQWRQLRTEFASRRITVANDNSVESGYSDDRECSSSSDEEPGYETDVSECAQKASSSDDVEELSEITGNATISNVIESEIEIDSSDPSGTPDVHSEHKTDNFENTDNRIATTSIETAETSEEDRLKEELPQSNEALNVPEASAALAGASREGTQPQQLPNELMTEKYIVQIKEAIEEGETEQGATVDFADNTHRALLEPVETAVTMPDEDKPRCSSDIAHVHRVVTEENVAQTSPEDNKSQQSLEERLARRDERMKRLEGQAQQLVAKVTNTANRSVVICNKLDDLHEVYGQSSSATDVDESVTSSIATDNLLGDDEVPCTDVDNIDVRPTEDNQE